MECVLGNLPVSQEPDGEGVPAIDFCTGTDLVALLYTHTHTQHCVLLYKYCASAVYINAYINNTSLFIDKETEAL